MKVKFNYPENLFLHTTQRSDPSLREDGSLSNNFLKPILVQEFSEEGFRKFYNNFQVFLDADMPIIPVIIDSYGGEVYSLLGMIDLFKMSPVPVLTLSISKSMSCGSFLAAFGTLGYRYISPQSTIMAHSISSFEWGKLEDLKADVAETERLGDLLFNQLDAACGRKKGFFRNVLKENHNANAYYGPIECKEYGLVDHIGIPKIDINYDWSTNFNISVEKPFKSDFIRKKKKVYKKRDGQDE